MIKIIVEPANYWHGDFNLLKALLMESVSAQADYFKVQVFNADKLGNAWHKQRKRYKSMEINGSRLAELQDMCLMYGIELIATLNTSDRAELLHHQHVNNVKIASGQIHPFLIDAITRYHWEKVFVSTGMVEDYDTLALIEQLQECADEVVIMHCVSLYPTYDSEVNLSRILSLQKTFPWASIGYSDHQMDDMCCVAAMGMGATYLEKHVAVPECFGPTSEIAANPADLGRLVGVKRRIERMLGDGTLACQLREKPAIQHYQRRYMLDG